MASYSSFSLKKIKNELGVVHKVEELIKNPTPKKPTEWLLNVLKFSEELPIKSEKARSELIVMPILLELRNTNNKFFTIYSGDALNVDESKGLKGECDFILAKDTQSFEVNFPILQIVEAKKHDLDIGIPQCAAQLIGAKIFNDEGNVHLDKIYGCVTTGDTWKFLALIENTIIIDTKKYYLGNLEELLGAFQSILDYYNSIF